MKKRISRLAIFGLAICAIVFAGTVALAMYQDTTIAAAFASLFGVTLLGKAGKFLIFAIGNTAVSYGVNTQDFTPDKLLAAGPVSTEDGTLLSGENRARGTLLGKILLGVLSETHAGNTGDGAMTIDAVTPRLANCQAGVYKAVCIVSVPGGGTFRVTDPLGNMLGDVVVGGTFQDQIKFVIAAGAVDFIEGDTFNITVAAGSGKLKMSAAAADDGSQIPYGILVDAVDASAADTTCGVYTRGEFNSNGMTFGAGHTAASVAAGLRSKGIVIKTAVPTTGIY